MAKSPPLWRVSFKKPLLEAAAYAEALEPLAVAVSWLDEDDDGIAEVEALFEAEPDRALLKAILKPVGPVVRLTIKQLPPTDWLAESYRALPALTIGPFFVHGAHIKKKPPKGAVPLLIEAATAFGSGSHPTTAGCLTLLAGLDEPKKVLDMGCGSGILAVAAAKLWPKAKVLAVDNDAEAVRVTKVHAKDNSARIKTAVGDGYKTPAVKEQAPYELVLANILAEPLIAMAPAAYKATAKGGHIILAGLMTGQEKAVLKAYKAVGFTLKNRHHKGDWPSLLMLRSSKK